MKLLDGLAELVPLKTKKPDEFIGEAQDCDALLNTYAGPITAEVMGRMPKCRIIARYGIGVDTIDLEAATRAGIIVTNNPSYCIDEVAEHTIALVLEAKTIAGCALDTTDPEPLPDPHPLRGRDNVIVTPHVAWYSEQALVGLQAGAPGEVRRVLMGEWPINVVNRAVKGKNRAGL